MQFEYRKRFSNGFCVNTSYTWSLAEVQQRYGFTKPLEWIDQAGQVGNVRHALQGELVASRCRSASDRKYGADMNGFLDAIVGGWSMDGVGRLQTGEMLDFGNVRLVGMTQKDLQKEIKVQQGPGGQIFILPADILDNTVKAFSVSATSASGYGALGAPTGRYFAPANGPDCIESAPGYGDCGLRSVVVNGPSLVRFDLGISKKFDLPGRFMFEFRGEMLNAFNEPVLQPGVDGRHAARLHDHHHGPGGTGGRRHADGEHDRRDQRRQLPPHRAARRQPVAAGPVGVATALVRQASRADDRLQASRLAGQKAKGPVDIGGAFRFVPGAALANY